LRLTNPCVLSKLANKNNKTHLRTFYYKSSTLARFESTIYSSVGGDNYHYSIPPGHTYSLKVIMKNDFVIS
jgi:hypothetical protein